MGARPTTAVISGDAVSALARAIWESLGVVEFSSPHWKVTITASAPALRSRLASARIRFALGPTAWL